jgi:hypothetical protein
MTADVFSEIANLDPALEPGAAPDWDTMGPAVLSAMDEGRGSHRTHRRPSVPQDRTRRSRGWFIPVAAFVVVVVGAAVTVMMTGQESLPPASPTTTATPTALPIHGNEDPLMPIAPDTYLTTIPNGFFPGLRITIPDGWLLTTNNAGGLGFIQAGHPDDMLMIWKDMAAVTTNNRRQTTGELRNDVGRTADELIAYLTTSEDFTILAPPESVTLSGTLDGIQLTLTVSDTADFGDTDCPFDPKCADILTDPIHWDGPWGIGGDEAATIIISTINDGIGDHTLFVVLDASSQTNLARLTIAAEPIIHSIQLPPEFATDQ